uniref:Uncharacterized protein n=1 Tax=Plectus sambesii TaxID=2011161 RepID=A0A914WME5_9BILA
MLLSIILSVLVLSSTTSWAKPMVEIDSTLTEEDFVQLTPSDTDEAEQILASLPLVEMSKGRIVHERDSINNGTDSENGDTQNDTIQLHTERDYGSIIIKASIVFAICLNWCIVWVAMRRLIIPLFCSRQKQNSSISLNP